MKLCIRRVKNTLLIPGVHTFNWPWLSTGEPCLEPNFLFDYLGKVFLKHPDPYRAIKQRILNCQAQHLIIANEAFLPAGLRRDNIYRALGPDWIRDVAILTRQLRPDIKIWINDFRPRCLKSWANLRAYAAQCPVDGISIQVHAELSSPLPSVFASPHNSPPILQYHIDKIKSMGLMCAFSEVTGWSTDQRKRGRWYKAIVDLGMRNELEFLTFWSPTPNENWHWKTPANPPPAHLWDEQGHWLFDWNLPLQ